MTRCLEIIDVTKVYPLGNHNIPTLDRVSFHVHDREFFCVIGPSGCGKSTLLRMMAGLDAPTSGEIRLRGERITHPHPKISMVFQSFALFPWRNTLQNIEYGLEVRGVPKAERRRIAEELIELVGLKGYEYSYPKQLSGGMKQRVGLARALAVDPEIVLMDEPFSALDEFTAQTLRSEVVELWKSTGKVFILVTHNLTEAVELADRIVVLSARPARVKNLINVDLKRPRNRSNINFIRCQKNLFNLLREELENTIMRHRLRAIHEHHAIEDIEE
ncbi:MAG: ABC transporter ATP-binding protein [Candidatus Bathyarchaeia archaeon]